MATATATWQRSMFTMRRIRFKEKYMTTQWEESDVRKSTWQHNEKIQIQGKLHDNTMQLDGHSYSHMTKINVGLLCENIGRIYLSETAL
jgi:hypothetical protein